MKVLSFQIQLKTSLKSANEIVKEIDEDAPIPQALEGGDGQGPLFESMIDAAKELSMYSYFTKSKYAIIYTRPRLIEVDEGLYNPDSYVHWQFGKDSILTKKPINL